MKNTGPETMSFEDFHEATARTLGEIVRLAEFLRVPAPAHIEEFSRLTEHEVHDLWMTSHATMARQQEILESTQDDLIAQAIETGSMLPDSTSPTT